MYSGMPCRPLCSILQLSVFLMILGSVIAAIHDVSFDFVGYSYVLLNDVFTAFNGVVTKQVPIPRPPMGQSL